MSMPNALRIARSDPIPSDPPRFVVAGQAGTASGDVKMYEWHRKRGDMRLVGLQTDVGQVRALKWSPLPSHRHLVSLGLSTGKTLILSLSSNTLSQSAASTSKPTPSTPTLAVLPIKHTRAVTCLSFSPLDPNYLATGYERHRSDYSLLIWDLASALSVVPPDGDEQWQRPIDRLEVSNPLARNSSEPKHIQHYCPSEQVNDVAFLPGSHQLLASANNKVIRLYDLRVPSPTKGSSFPREPSLANLAGAAYQWSTRAVLGLSPDPSHDFRFASYESSPGGSAGTVRLWDSRKSGETMSFDVRGGVTGLEWYGGEAGFAELGVGTRDGIALWDIIDGPVADESHVEDWTSIEGVRNVAKPKQTIHSFTFSNPADGRRSDVMFVMKDGTLGIGPIDPPPTLATGPRGDIALSTSFLTILDPENTPSDLSRAPSRNEADMDGQSDNSDADDSEITRSNQFQLAPHRITTILEEASRSRETSRASSIRDVQRPEDGSRRKIDAKELSRRKMDNASEGLDIGLDGWMRVLSADVGCVMRRRAEEGYGLGNLLLNAAVATRYPGHDRLAGIWEFIDHITNVMDTASSTTRTLNLTFAGIQSIWTGLDLDSRMVVSSGSESSIGSQSTHTSDFPAQTPFQNAHREPIKQGSAAWTSLRNTQHQQLPSRSQLTSTPHTSSSPESTIKGSEPVLPDADFAAALEIINARRDQEEHRGKIGTSRLPRSDKVPQRRMILAVCGEREASEVNRLIEDKQRPKAASWAYFSGQEENAIRILMNSNNSKHRLLGTTLAGFLSQTRSTRANDFFDEHWRSLMNRVDDPYMRAVLSRVGGDDWDSVLQEEAIPLLDRVAIAVSNLKDDELGAFLKNRLTRFTRNPSPSLSSLGLTGFTSPAIPLFQRWLERTGDVQTIALLSSFFPQSRLTSSDRDMVRRWTESYRDLLDSWGMWGERVEFDIGRMDLGRNFGEERIADAVDGEAGTMGSGLCPICNNVLSQLHEGHVHTKSGLSQKSHPNERTGACMLCGQVLPRCVICLRHVEPRFFSAHARDDLDGFPTMNLSDTIDQAYVCCMTCRHGGHANHILPWFQGGLDGETGNDVCPVAGCSCECANI